VYVETPDAVCFERRLRREMDGTAALDWKVEQVLAAMRGRGLLQLHA